MPHCGSACPKGWALNASRNGCHWVAVAEAAKKPITTGAPMNASFRSGSNASRYRSRSRCCGVVGTYIGRCLYARCSLSQTTPHIRMTPTRNNTALVVHCVNSTWEYPSWSNHTHSVQNRDNTRKPMLTATSTPIVGRSGPRRPRDGRGEEAAGPDEAKDTSSTSRRSTVRWAVGTEHTSRCYRRNNQFPIHSLCWRDGSCE